MRVPVIDVQKVVQAILEKRGEVPTGESMLAAISGIDGSGKGYVTSQLVRELQERGVNAVGINVDGWLNLPSIRFNPDRPAEHFYHHAIRFDEMFAQLILPLKRQRSIRVETDFAEETAHAFRRHLYVFQNVDIILLEGIYLLQRAFRKHYHWKVWVDCSLETALERALRRGQEGLPPDETIHAYRTIYFPAQEIHFRLDDPRATADAVIINDPRLVPGPM
jgi:uridine kinase